MLHCHDTVTGWAECPGQPSDDPCEHDESNPLSFTGAGQITGQIPEVHLPPGEYDIQVCLQNNNITTGQASPFSVFIADSTYEVQSDAVWEPVGVVEGEWQAQITVPSGFDALLEIHVTPEGDGTWVVTFIPSG